MPASLFDDPFLLAQWGADFDAFRASEEADALHQRLRAWAQREILNETASETAFIQRFFVETWGYTLQGHDHSAAYSCSPQYKIAGTGQTGGAGFADLALGSFGTDADGIPQVLCEFKDIRSGLDSKQARKDNTRSPVEQCFDYLQVAWQNRDRDQLVEPQFALVTDMNEFRLYLRRLGPGVYQRFVLVGSSSSDPGLLDDTSAAAFRRFLFWRLFRADMLLAQRGSAALDSLLRDQIVHEKAIEKDFYREYRDYRQTVYQTLLAANPDFPGTRGQLVRLTQRFLDRCIFILFCEDMGSVLRYPPDLLREFLIERSQSRFYDPEGSGPWDEMRALFRAMRDGGSFGPYSIDRFNGGLFADDPELDALHIPAKLFCVAGQAGDPTAHPRTLLYFSAAYNFGLSSAAGERAISLQTLGRIFEQSITELEIMEAEAEGRISLNKLGKRKTDGVYYTPEWVVNTIIEQTLGARLQDIKTELGFYDLAPLDAAAIDEYRIFLRDRRRTAKTAGEWKKFIESYRFRLDQLRIVDPACGSGAFLIQALKRLIEEYRWILAEKERLEGTRSLFDQDALIRSILSYNIYGVDINQESVEITKLALWLHTASPGKPLCTLDTNIRCGNSLVGPDFADFYEQRHQSLFEEVDPNQRELINAFDWQAAFPEVFSHGGFDCVIGNPPYIKLQHFRRAQDDVAAYLTEATRPDGSPLYASTQSGNFDMYLPFLEKGVQLLNPDGRMGYIAPNVWMVNEYGKSLRRLLHRTRQLDRWLDFKSHQIFDEAITYTSLQFFRAKASDHLTCAFAPDGNAAAIHWDKADQIPYEELPEEEAWTLAPRKEMELMKKLREGCRTLEEVTSKIFQGLVSGADPVFRLQKQSTGRYIAKLRDQEPYEVEIEDEIMFPVIAGSETGRYLKGRTNLYILFPYDTSEPRPTLYSEDRLKEEFPLAYKHLLTHKELLQSRDNGAWACPQWYSYSRSQNLDKQFIKKICSARLVPTLRMSYDEEAKYCLHDNNMFGVLAENEEDNWFLLGILNAPVCDYIFRRSARPKSSGYFQAHRQFLAPLPIPDATTDQHQSIGDLARELQELHTRRRDWVAKLDQRLQSGQTTPLRPALAADWLWAQIGTPSTWKRSPEAPAGLSARELTAWAKARHQRALDEQLAALDHQIRPGSTITVTNTEDELLLHIDGRDHLHLYDRPDTPFIAAQWRHALRDLNVTEAFTATRLVKLLLDQRTTTDESLRARILQLDTEITALDTTIAQKEQHLNHQIYPLYYLTPEEIQMVEKG